MTTISKIGGSKNKKKGVSENIQLAFSDMMKLLQKRHYSVNVIPTDLNLLCREKEAESSKDTFNGFCRAKNKRSRVL